MFGALNQTLHCFNRSWSTSRCNFSTFCRENLFFLISQYFLNLLWSYLEFFFPQNVSLFHVRCSSKENSKLHVITNYFQYMKDLLHFRCHFLLGWLPYFKVINPERRSIPALVASRKPNTLNSKSELNHSHQPVSGEMSCLYVPLIGMYLLSRWKNV